MGNIAKCSGNNCPLKDKCLRFTAPNSDSPWQSWLVGAPFKDGGCIMFKEIK